MPKRKPLVSNGRFGERLAGLRKTAGYTQQELADELEITRRMVVYYERETEHPPASLLAALAKTLSVSSDELLGIKSESRKTSFRDARLWRRFKQIEKLPPKERRYLTHLIDTFLKGVGK